MSGAKPTAAKPHKIVAINGSHRGDRGYTRFLIDRLFQGAAEAGAECEVVTLAKLKIQRCRGCERCHEPETFLHCVYEEKDDVRQVFARMAAADVIVYATPVYVFGMSGLMKTFLDRLNGTSDTGDLRLTQSGLLFHQVDGEICSKPFVTLICCENLEAETPRNALAYFRTFGRFMDAPQVGELVRNGGRLTGQGKDAAREARFPKIRVVYAAYEQAGRELAREGRIHRSTQRRANQEILPVPLFGLLKRLPLRPVKEGMVRQARKMQEKNSAATGASALSG